jgi:hypothetical protein
MELIDATELRKQARPARAYGPEMLVVGVGLVDSAIRHAEETHRADAAEARATRLASALRILIERHEDEVNGGTPITGEEWEIASYALPRIDSDA